MLRPVAGIVFKPLTLEYSFRWGGEFGPQTRGPQAYAQSSPVPLPSNTAGVLAGAALAAKKQPLCTPQAGPDPFSDVKRGLRLLLCPEGDGFTLRGPYLYARQGDKWLLCAPLGRSQGLLCVANPGDKLKVCTTSTAGIQTVGIAINNLSKTVIESNIYTSVYTDPLEALRAASAACSLGLNPAKADTAGILVEAYMAENCGIDTGTLKELLDGALAPLGGETRPARIHVTSHVPGLELAQALWKGSSYLYIATPLLVPSSAYTVEEEPRRLIPSLLRALGLEPGPRPLAWGRLRLTAIGLGYSLCRNRRRPYHAAILPGAVLEATTARSLPQAYMQGFGVHREVGWGTILPLPEPPEKKEKKCRARAQHDHYPG